jgi:hypothetical protein
MRDWGKIQPDRIHFSIPAKGEKIRRSSCGNGGANTPEPGNPPFFIKFFHSFGGCQFLSTGAFFHRQQARDLACCR